jgi:uncharacterized protein (TIGR00304 family)
MLDWSLLITIGIIFIILGFMSIAIGVMSQALRNKSIEEKAIPATGKESGEKVKGGGVILIGPIPIVFGTDRRYAFIAIILTIVLMLLAMIYLIII